jgi:hypothetical protein
VNSSGPDSPNSSPLTAGVSTNVRFTAVEGANEHCQPLARALTAQRIFDWLDDRIEESGRVKTGVGIDAGQVHGVPGGSDDG